MTLPIPVRSVDLADARDDLSGLGEAIEAHIVVRHHGAPLCRVRAPVVGGRVPISAVWDACVASLEDRGDVVFPHVPAGTVTLAPCTVVVCTKDRPDDLRRCLKALAPFAAASVELLVVDNAPSDDRTRAVVREFPATYICQMRQGLNWARHAGVEAAQHGIVLFVDDDVVVEPDWLDQMRRPFRDDSVGGVTGIINASGMTITATVPVGTSLSGLIATFTTTGSSVRVLTTVQTSGATANDFSSPVSYVVTDGNGATATYTVTATVASAAKVCLGAGCVDLGKAGNFAILSKAGITDVPPSPIVGNIGTSPITAMTMIAWASTFIEFLR